MKTYMMTRDKNRVDTAIISCSADGETYVVPSVKGIGFGWGYDPIVNCRNTAISILCDMFDTRENIIPEDLIIGFRDDIIRKHESNIVTLEEYELEGYIADNFPQYVENDEDNG